MNVKYDESNPSFMEKFLVNDDINMEKGEKDLQVDESSKDKQDDPPYANDARRTI